MLLSEKAEHPDNLSQLLTLKKSGVAVELGGHSRELLACDFLVVSPGVPVTAEILALAREKDIRILAEIEVASWFCQAPIVAVTGSNGKSTTCALLGEIFKKAGFRTIVAGNIGNPFSDLTESIGPEGVVVLEVSSFQLETVLDFHPKVSVILNLTPDHLDRHGDMRSYGELKARIFGKQRDDDVIICHGTDPLLQELVGSARARVWHLGADRGNDCGFVRDQKLILRRGGMEQEILPCSEMRLRGEHNWLNGLAASMAASVMKVELSGITTALKDFAGLPHRMEPVRVLRGVEWINDSKATNVDSVWYALGGFDQSIILIAGGRDKDSDFTLLRTRVQEKVKHIILIGEAAEKIKAALEGATMIHMAGSLEEAVSLAEGLAQSGDVVLLSPACASFDMFHNFENRGERFKQLVREL